MFKEKIIIEMKEVFKEIPFGIEHTLKVLKNAEDIMKGENIGEEEKEFISIIAILHDIGAVEAQKKYGSIDGVYQEKEGPEVAKEILKKVGYNKNIDRICFIIGNHHTPSKIDGLDIKHTDDGETKIETPEKGASFEIYLKSAGSYDAANKDERDTIVCDENGFGQTKDMPYGIYTVHQLYFIIKWAVKNGIKEAYRDITGKVTTGDIEAEQICNEEEK